MTFSPPIPIRVYEDDFVASLRGLRIHRAFSTNSRVLTHCGRWLSFDGISVWPDYHPEMKGSLCQRCASTVKP